MKLKIKRFKRGSILAFILVISVCLAIIGWDMLQMGFGSRLNSAISASRISAREAADAGIAKALYELNYHFDIFKNGSGWSEPVSGNDTLYNSKANYSYVISTYNYSSSVSTPYSGNYLIESIGTSGGESVKVCAVTGVRNSFGYAVIVTDKIELKEKAFIDGYDSNLGPYDEINNSGIPVLVIGTTYAGHDYRIFLRNYVTVKGDVIVGVGGNPDEIIWDEATPGATTGPRYAMNEAWEFETIDVPDCGPSLGNLNTKDFTPVYTIGEPGVVTNVMYDNILIPNGGVLKIVGDVNLCITDTLDLDQGAQLIVEDEPWSSVKIYLYGGLSVGQSALINNETKKPRNFWLFGTGTSPAGENWTINNGGNYYGVYYGPNANINVKQSAVFYGSISGNNFILAQSGMVHYDKDLENVSQYDIGFGIDRWWEETIP